MLPTEEVPTSGGRGGCRLEPDPVNSGKFVLNLPEFTVFPAWKRAKTGHFVEILENDFPNNQKSRHFWRPPKEILI